jgi:predicted nucleic acid-binding protein
VVGREIYAADVRDACQRAARHAAVDPLPRVERSSDPDDDYLLALSEAGKADYLVTGDKNGLLELDTHKGARIISARDFAALFA